MSDQRRSRGERGDGKDVERRRSSSRKGRLDRDEKKDDKRRDKGDGDKDKRDSVERSEKKSRSIERARDLSLSPIRSVKKEKDRDRDRDRDKSSSSRIKDKLNSSTVTSSSVSKRESKDKKERDKEKDKKKEKEKEKGKKDKEVKLNLAYELPQPPGLAPPPPPGLVHTKAKSKSVLKMGDKKKEKEKKEKEREKEEGKRTGKGRNNSSGVDFGFDDVYGGDMNPTNAHEMSRNEESSDSEEDSNSNGYSKGSNGRGGGRQSDSEKNSKQEELAEGAGFCEILKYMFVKFCGARCLAFLVRRKFVLTRLFICFAYFLVGVEYYHSREGWDRTTCVYFITVSTTTVGYGDYHPTTDSTRLFTTLYVIFGLLVVLSSVNDIIQYLVVKKLQHKILQCIDSICRFLYRKCSRDGVAMGSSLESQSWFKLVFSLSCVAGMIMAGTIFFIANESFTFIEALYWTVMTMTTVGYGDLDVQNESSRVFSTWFIWLCVVVYVMALSNVFETFEELKNEALRLEILKQHAVDIVDVMDETSRGGDDHDGRSMAGLSVGSGVLEMLSMIKEGITGKENEQDDRTKRRKSIAAVRQSITLGTFEAGKVPGASDKDEEPAGPPPAGSSSPMHKRDRDREKAEKEKEEDKAKDREAPPPPPSSTKRANTKPKEKDAVDLEKAKEDRFVLEMLYKMNKVKYEKEIQPLITHFHKLEMLKDKSANKQELKAKLEQENQGMLSGFLGGIAQNMVMTKKAVSKKNVFSDE